MSGALRILELLDRLGLADAAVARGVKTTTVEVSRSRRYPVSMPTPASRADPLRPRPSLTMRDTGRPRLMSKQGSCRTTSEKGVASINRVLGHPTDLLVCPSRSGPESSEDTRSGGLALFNSRSIAQPSPHYSSGKNRLKELGVSQRGICQRQAKTDQLSASQN